MCRYYQRSPRFGEFLVCTGASLLSGIAPDTLEPALNPNHRAIGHSVAMGAWLAQLGISACGKKAESQEFQKILLATAILSYVSHLVADAFTPKRLPVLGIKGHLR
jgi:membrane-bound metal-dependent hydrolase YbcI (DUF457 family)